MDYSTLQMYTIAVRAYIEQRKRLIVRNDFFEILCDGIAGFLAYWTGNTYVGNKKTITETAIFQDFFRSLSSLVVLLQDEKICPTIQGIDYNPNENHDKDWDAIEKGTLVIEVANFGSCYRVYRKDLWYHSTEDLKNKYYFFVELKFSDNDPTRILVQKLIKRYGQKAQESIIYKFLDDNKDIIHDGNTWGVLETEKFINLSEYRILSAEWKDALKEKAAKFITEAIDEMDEIFGRFESWKSEKQ